MKLSESEKFFKEKEKFAREWEKYRNPLEYDEHVKLSNELDVIAEKKLKEYQQVLFPRTVEIYNTLKSEEAKKRFSDFATLQIADFVNEIGKMDERDHKYGVGSGRSGCHFSSAFEAIMVFEFLRGMLKAFEEGKTLKEFNNLLDQVWGENEHGGQYSWLKGQLFTIWEEEEKFAKNLNSGLNA